MENKMTLYTISEELSNILNAIEANDGEITPELDEALTITNEQFAAKSEDYGHAILNLEALAAAAKAEKDRLAGLQKYYENVRTRLKERLGETMDALGIPKVETPTMRLSLRRTTFTVVDDVNLLPDDLKTTKVEVVADKTAVKKAIQEGREVEGAHLVENVSLQIK